MLRLALRSGRGRLGTFTGALVALIAASVLTTAWGMQLESVLRGHPPVERYAGAAAVVTGQQIVGPDHDVPLDERARVSTALVSRLAAVPGVRAASAAVARVHGARPHGDRRRRRPCPPPRRPAAGDLRDGRRGAAARRPSR